MNERVRKSGSVLPALSISANTATQESSRLDKVGHAKKLPARFIGAGLVLAVSLIGIFVWVIPYRSHASSDDRQAQTVAETYRRDARSQSALDQISQRYQSMADRYVALIEPRPIFSAGVTHYIDGSGFSLWVPSDWYKFVLTGGREGVLFSPYPANIQTSFLAERHCLGDSMKESDLPALRNQFTAGIMALEGVEIEEGSYDEFFVSKRSFYSFEIRFTYIENGMRRKRWVRDIYWGDDNFIFFAQGRTPEEYDYWQPMFYQIMVNLNV